MTEAEWLAASGPTFMMSTLRGRSSDRKFRLFAVACCRLVRHLLPDVAWWHAVEVAERFADGEVSEHELYRADEDACTLIDEVNDPVARYACHCVCETTKHSTRFNPDLRAWGCAEIALEGEVLRKTSERDTPQHVSEILEAWAEVCVQSGRPEGVLDSGGSALLVQSIRDIFGNPFRPVAVAPSWQTETVVAVATGIYAERAFDRMPILADALEDIGCDSADILAHCRSDGPHVRGCWVVDLLLGKE